MRGLSGPAPIDPASGLPIDMGMVDQVLGSMLARGPLAPVIDIHGEDWPRVDHRREIDGLASAEDPWIMKRVKHSDSKHMLDGVVHEALPGAWKRAA